jgi:hypothetical protein
MPLTTTGLTAGATGLAPGGSTPLGASIRPDPDTARSWVERELGRPEYRQGLLERFLGWLGDVWNGLQDAALGASPLTAGAAVLVVVVLAVLVAVVVARVRREPSGDGRGGPAPLLGAGASPEQHRTAAEQALADADHDRALVEAFRAVASRAVQRGLVEDRPGVTAHELAVGLGPVFPRHADDLAAASALFDRVFYGHRPATADGARSVLDLDEALRLARPGPDRAQAGTPSPAVPR